MWVGERSVAVYRKLTSVLFLCLCWEKESSARTRPARLCARRFVWQFFCHSLSSLRLRPNGRTADTHDV